jgi:hypothetical protein
MNSLRDPARMLPEERLAEVAEIVTRAYLRLLRRREKELALGGKDAALLEPVGGKDPAPGKEPQ